MGLTFSVPSKVPSRYSVRGFKSELIIFTSKVIN